MDFPWKRKPLPTGEALYEEAKELGVSTYGLPEPLWRGDSDSHVRNRRNEPEMQSRVLAARAALHNTRVAYVQSVGIIFTLLLTLGLAIWNGRRQSDRESADLMLKFNEMLNSGDSRTIIRELDMFGDLNRLTPERGALDDAIDEFLSDYELLNAAYQHKLINKDMAYDAFSYDLEKALRDAKIRQFISESQGEESDIYGGVLELAQSFGIKFPPIAASTPTTHKPANQKH